jgi:hypothetical protein
MSEIKVRVHGSGTVTQQPLRGEETIQLKAIPDGWLKLSDRKMITGAQYIQCMPPEYAT